MKGRAVDFVWLAWIVIVLVVLLAPIAVLVLSSFDDGTFFRFPPKVLSFRWYQAAFGSAEYQKSLLVSAGLAVVATFTSVCFGGLAALALVRGEPRQRLTIEALLLAPLALPLVVWAIALLQIYARLRLSGTLLGLLLAHATITLPYSVRIMIATFSQINPNLDAAARSLGASPLRAFWRVTLPLSASGLFASAAIAFFVSFNDVIVSSFIAGAGWITFPVRLYSELRGQGINPITMAIGAMIIAAILAFVLVGETRLRLSKRL